MDPEPLQRGEWERQSSYNPNLPVRFLMYLGTLWSGWLYGSDDLDVYGTRLIELPVPRFVVFYNGTEKEREEMVLRLSDAFPEAIRDKSDIELKVTISLLTTDMGWCILFSKEHLF